jgi:hypothetical protein
MDHDDFEGEPVHGLPEALPPGERILWQGRPAIGRLAREALSLPWVAGWFVALFVWRWAVLAETLPAGQAALHASFTLALGGAACALLVLIAAVQARATVYTVTNRRIAMRIGAALTMTLQFPFSRIEAADLKLNRDGTGTIALRTAGDTRFAYALLWPHLRPWRMRRTEPALRCIPGAESVARLLTEAVAAERDMPRISRADPIGEAVPPARPPARPSAAPVPAAVPMPAE